MAKYALVIGIPEYQSFAALPNTTTDAEAIAQLLESQGHFQAIKRLPEGWNTAKNDYEVAAQGLTGKTLGDTLKTFLLEQATQSDAVIYFTGHGFTIADNLGQQSGYLATSDCCVEWEGDRAVGQRYGISLDSLNALIQQANLSSLVLLLDCCHSGFFIEQSIVSQSLTALLRKDYYLITSSRSFESSWSGEKHSVFTGALLNSLSASNAGSDGYVTVDRVFDFIQRQLRNSGQEPVRLGWGRSIGLIHYPPSEFEEQNTTLNPQNPYLGLQAFEGSHTTYFYGRETAINALLERLSKGRFLSVIGASGCGKSSLVKAGLIPKLQDNPLPDSNQWAIAQFTPGSEPLHRLLNTLAPLHNQNQPFLVFIDQFEEIFTQCKDEAQRRDFFRLISEEATTKKRQGRVVIAVRGDFLDRCAEYNEIAILINRTQPTTYFVEPLSLSELEAAIVKPAEQHGVSLEPGLAAQMAETVAHQPGALPLLQYALQQLWRVCITEADSTHPYLTWAGYEQIEGVGGALEKRANLIYNSFGQESDRDLVRRLFLELVELGDGNTVFRRQQSQKSLNAIADSPEQLQFVLERLSQERLIVITTEKTGENTFENYVEVTHEALLCRWELLRTWIDQNRDNIRLKRRFEADCLAWRDRYEESEDALLTGLWLSDIIAWKEQENPRLLPTENQFIAQSIARRDRDFQDKLNQERKLREEAEARVKVQKQKKRLAIATSLVICLLSIVTLTVNDKRQRSDTFLIGSLVGKAEQLLKSNHQIDALIASIEALQEIKKRNLGNTENIKRINTILAEVNEKNYFLAEDGGLYALDFVSKSNNIVTGGTSGNIKTFTNKVSPIPSVFSSQKEHEQAIWNIASDFQKNTFVTAGLDNFIKLWTTNGDFLGELNHGEKVYDVIFWKQHYLISSGANSNILIWDRRTKRKINEITDPNIENVEKYYIFALDIHPTNPNIIVSTGYEDCFFRIWNLDEDSSINSMKCVGKTNLSIAALKFHPSGKFIASGDGSGNIKLWDINGNNIRTIQAGHELIYDLDFSHDGTLMASTGQDGSIKVWNLENIQNIENPIKTMEIGTIVYRIRFHPQSKNILVSASEDGILRTWMIFNNLHQGRKNVNLFVESSCDFLADYFANNPQQQPRICQ